MDLNYLFHRHQISVMRADAASCLPSSASHRGLARGYAQRIRAMQENLDAFAPFEQPSK